jgi:hypothetical protein
VTVRVQDVPLIAAWQVYMEFEDSIINVTRWFEPTTDPQYIFYGKTTYANPTPPDPGYLHLNSSIGRVKVSGALWLPPPAQEPASGNGTLCVLEFMILSYPTSGNITSLLHINSKDTFLLDSDGAEISSVAKLDGSFSYIFITIPPLRLIANPQFVHFTPYQNMTGGSFNMTVAVSGPTSEAGLHNVSFSLTYDLSLLSTSESNVSLNNVWVGPYNFSVNAGQINISVSTPSSLPSEPNVVICIIEFMVLQQQAVPPEALGDYVETSINFTSSTMLDSVGNAISQISPSGQVVRIYAYQTETTILSISEPVITGPDTVIHNRTPFAVNVSMTDVYDPSLVQVELVYDQSIISCIDAIPIGDVASDESDINVSQPGLAIAKLSISGHQNPLISGPIFTFDFKAVTGNATIYLNFSRPYGKDTFIRDSSGTLVNATYHDTTIRVSARLLLESPQSHLDTSVNKRYSFQLVVKNEGNLEATNISLSSHGVPMSWLQFSEDKFSLVPNSNETLLVTVAPTYTGEFNLTIVAMSAEGDSATARVTLSVTESTANPPWELIIPTMIIGIGAVTALLIVRSRRRKKT